MSGRHTAGPWAYHETAGNHDFSVYPEHPEASGRDVALVRDFNEANARLIAAAPDMHAELEAIAAQLEDWDDGMPGDARMLLRARAKPIRALLARIDGE